MRSLQDQHCALSVSAYRHVDSAVNDMIIEVGVLTACKHNDIMLLVMQHAILLDWASENFLCYPPNVILRSDLTALTTMFPSVTVAL